MHIIAFDVPYPPNYGGVIDIFYKVKSLAEIGVKITLHCFEYGRGEAASLEEYCEKVYYYKRNLNRALLIHSAPFIVVSRRDNRLIENLLEDDNPILYEGLHSCFSFSNIALRKRRKYIRAHNIEHHYYRGLAKASRNFFRRSYFKSESRKLEAFEKIMLDAQAVISISPLEQKIFESKYKHVELIYPFHGNESIVPLSKKEKFAFYHGNLGVDENNKAALFLAKDVFNQIDYKLIIAGRRPSKELREVIASRENVELLDSLDNDRIIEMINKAQINILPTFQSTGIKLKLINALFNGGHCLVNELMVKDTGLASTCVLANGAEEMREAVLLLRNKDFSEEERNKRANILLEKLSDKVNAQHLADIIFESN